MPGIVNTRILLAPAEEHTNAKANNRKTHLLHSIYTIVAEQGYTVLTTRLHVRLDVYCSRAEDSRFAQDSNLFHAASALSVSYTSPLALFE